MKDTSQAAIGMGRVAGVDGVRGGWVMAVTGAASGAPVAFSTWSSFAEVLAAGRDQDIAALAVDVPIGLRGTERRTADVRAHAMLGQRRSSLFWTPPLYASLVRIAMKRRTVSHANARARACPSSSMASCQRSGRYAPRWMGSRPIGRLARRSPKFIRKSASPSSQARRWPSQRRTRRTERIDVELTNDSQP